MIVVRFIATLFMSMRQESSAAESNSSIDVVGDAVAFRYTATERIEVSHRRLRHRPKVRRGFAGAGFACRRYEQHRTADSSAEIRGLTRRKIWLTQRQRVA